MRCSPIALFTYSKSLEEMKLACELATRITHTHIWSVLGALQQCYAIRLALYSVKTAHSFDFDEFMLNVISFVCDIEKKYELLDATNKDKLLMFSESMQASFLLYLEQKKFDRVMRHCSRNSSSSPRHAAAAGSSERSSSRSRKLAETTGQYSALLRKLHRLVQKCRRGERINIQRLHKHVATRGISALESVPVALLAFVIASDPQCADEVNFKLGSANAFKEYQPIERVIFYAISFGGETHKIASMAGALAGAFFSRRGLPGYLADMCEASDEVARLAGRLFELSVARQFEFLRSKFGAAAAAAGDKKQTNEMAEEMKQTTTRSMSGDEINKAAAPVVGNFNSSLETKVSSSSLGSD